MLRFIAKWWAKRRYIWKEEFEASVAELNAKSAFSQAQDKRDLLAQVTKEADAIEANIKRVIAKEEKGYWLCENGHEPEKARPDEKQPRNLCPTCGGEVKWLQRANMSGQEQYESDKERKEAEKILQSKRDYAAKQLSEEIKGHEATANHFRRQAAQSREFADRLRRL